MLDAQAAPGLGPVGGDDLAFDGQLGEHDRSFDCLVAAKNLEANRIARRKDIDGQDQRIKVGDRHAVDGDDLVVDLKLAAVGGRAGLNLVDEVREVLIGVNAEQAVFDLFALP